MGTEMMNTTGILPDYETDVAERAEHHEANWKDEPLTDSQQYALTGTVERRRFAR